MSLPAGSIVFTAYGAGYKFRSPTGVDLGQPVSAPGAPGGVVEGIVALKPSNKIVVVTGGGGVFPGSGVGLYNTDFTAVGPLSEPSGATIIPQWSIARDASDRLYSAGNAASIGRIFQFDATGQLNRWDGVDKHGGVSIEALGVNSAGTIAYYAAFGTSHEVTVYSWSLAGAGSDLGTFATFGSSFVVGTGGGILVLSTGDVLVAWRKAATQGFVIRYNAAGAVQQTYTLVGSNASPFFLTPGLTDSTFLVGYYVTGLPSPGFRVAEIDIATGAVAGGGANTFDPVDGSYAFDSPFGVLRTGIDLASPPDNPPPIPGNCCVTTPSTVDSPSPSAGCNHGGVGFTVSYTGASGSVPVGADPNDGETLTGKTTAHVWVEITHTAYPALTTEKLAYALTDLDDTLRKEGRLLSFGDVEHELSDGQGNASAGSANIKGSDVPDRPIGTRLVGGFFNRDELNVFVLSDAGRRSAATPRRLYRGLLQGDSYGSGA